MMAASVVGIGMAGKTGKLSPAISSPHSSSLHDPSVVAPSSSDSNSSPEEQSQFAKAHGSRMSFTHPEKLPLSSSSGKQLALSSSQGREASPAPSHSGTHEDETDIALSQLRELDIAIEVRKLTKVDGRKTRWIEYRKKRGDSDSSCIKEEDESFDEFIEEIPKRKLRGKKSAASEETVLDINENSSSVDTELSASVQNTDVKEDNAKIQLSVNNNNNIVNTSMKVESNVVVDPFLGATNVLETMKQQFLQGTVNLPETPTNGTKDKPLKRLKKAYNGIAGSENFKRKPGRPKKLDSFKIVPKTSTPIIKKEVAVTNDSACTESDASLTLNETNGVVSCTGINKKLEPPQSNISQSPTDFYSKRNFLTKGLREVRKSESGSESGTSSPEKNGTPTNTCPSTPLPVSPISHPLAGDLETSVAVKCPLITAAARALTAGNKKANFTFPARNKKFLKKFSKKENLLRQEKSNGHVALDKAFKKNMSSEIQSNNSITEDISNATEMPFIPKKRGRGRPKTKLEGEFGKKMSTVVVDVHNTMNGEPQAGIPAINLALQSKKKLPKKLSNFNHNESVSNVNMLPVPLKKLSPTLSNSSDLVNKFAKPQSASQNNDMKDSLANSDSTKNILNPVQNQIKEVNLETTLNASQSLETSQSSTAKSHNLSNGSNNNNTVWTLQSNSSKVTLLTPTTNYRPIAMKPQGLKKSPSTIIVSTAEAIKKTNQEKKQISPSEFPHKLQMSENGQNFCVKDISSSNINSKTNTVQHIVSVVTNTNLVENAEVPKLDMNKRQTPDKILKNRSIDAVIEKLQSPATKRNDSDADAPNTSHTEEDKSCLNVRNEDLPEANDEEKTKKVINKLSKSKEKVPRFLKQLFQDEGVQNMLRSVNEENVPAVEGFPAVDNNLHKLRPKRANENFTSESPEPDDSYLPNAKRKKRGTEVDKLFLDEGTLNLLTSLESASRRPGADDTASDCSHSSSSKSVKQSRPSSSNLLVNYEGEVPRKRKHSGSSVCSSLVGAKTLVDHKNMKTENKKSQISNVLLQPNQSKLTMEKKSGKTSGNIPLNQKTKVPLLVQLKRQLLRLGIDPSNYSIEQMKEIIASHHSEQPVPPLKIKLPYHSGEVRYSKPKVLDSLQKVSKPVTVAGPSKMSPQNTNNVVHKKVLNQQRIAQPIMSLMRPLDLRNGNQSKGKSRPLQEGIRQSQRASVRQNDGNQHYRDITLRKFNNFVQIILTPSTTKMKNALNARVMKEICEALLTLKRDDTVRMVLITGTGSTFCQGIDLTTLQTPNQETRKKNAENLAKAIKDFLRALVQFPKMIVAGVNGDAMGLGVTMLPLFDTVIASDKAEFYLPYGKLGQVPEGGATYTFPYNYGKLPSSRLFGGNKITAIQAQQIGLVTESLWPNTFLQELIPKVALLCAAPTHGLEATKALMNHHLTTKLELSVESENRLLVQHWSTTTFYNSCKRFLDSHDIPFQKPVNLPLY